MTHSEKDRLTIDGFPSVIHSLKLIFDNFADRPANRDIVNVTSCGGRETYDIVSVIFRNRVAQNRKTAI